MACASNKEHSHFLKSLNPRSGGADLMLQVRCSVQSTRPFRCESCTAFLILSARLPLSHATPDALPDCWLRSSRPEQEGIGENGSDDARRLPIFHMATTALGLPSSLYLEAVCTERVCVVPRSAFSPYSSSSETHSLTRWAGKLNWIAAGHSTGKTAPAEWKSGLLHASTNKQH